MAAESSYRPLGGRSALGCAKSSAWGHLTIPRCLLLVPKRAGYPEITRAPDLAVRGRLPHAHGT